MAILTALVFVSMAIIVTLSLVLKGENGKRGYHNDYDELVGVGGHETVGVMERILKYLTVVLIVFKFLVKVVFVVLIAIVAVKRVIGFF